MGSIHEHRIENLKKALKPREAAFISSKADIYYLSGFTGDDSFLFITHQQCYFLTDGRYVTQVASESQIPLKIMERKQNFSLFDIIKKCVDNEHIISIASSLNELTYMQYKFFMMLNLKVEDLTNVKEQRIIKTNDEIEQMRQNLMMTEMGYNYILKILEIGKAENEIALELEYYLKKQGASGMSFETIIASGARSALPHGQASDKKIADGDVLLCDFGIIRNFYCSDFTRTTATNTEKMNPKLKDIYKVVEASQKSAESVIKPGIKASSVDLIAREVIKKAGYEKYFNHSTGHGVGLDIHEEPFINGKAETILKPGMVFTVEPGIYLPKIGGVRLEDMVVVTETGCEVLTTTKFENW